MMFKIDILFNLFINDCMFIISTVENSKDLSTAKFDSKWAYYGLHYLCWVVIHIKPLHRLESNFIGFGC